MVNLKLEACTRAQDAGQEKGGGEESRGLEKESKYMVSGVIERKEREREREKLN